jgi:toxin ParE1/3/4
MNRRLIIRPEAEADLTDAAVWYDSREFGLGFELISEVNSAIARALKNPESFTRVRRNPVVRRGLTRRDKNGLYSCESSSTVYSR